MKLQLDEAGLTELGRAAIATQTEEVEITPLSGAPVGFVPTPTSPYRFHRKFLSATVQPGKPKLGPLTPLPLSAPGARVLMWKQDPSVAEIGIRKAFVPGLFFLGPKDFRIVTQGVTPVPPNAFGDFIATPNTEAFDTVHAFAVVRQVLTMYQRAVGGAPLPWEWNSSTNTDPLLLFPHAGETANAYYSRTEKALKFFYFRNKPTDPFVFTCRSLDIVAHETGHAVLDGLKPNWIMASNTPQTGALHESFGDLTSVFLTLSQLDQVEAIIAQTKGNVHDKTFLSDLAEQFGLALGRPNGLRNADNNLKLSDVGTEVHDLSQVFTGAIYDILADIYAFERQPLRKDDARVLLEAGEYVARLVLSAILAAPVSSVKFVDIANNMLAIAATDGKPVDYRNFIRNQFLVRQMATTTAPLAAAIAAEHKEGEKLVAAAHVSDNQPQNRSACCGTLQHTDYLGLEEAVQKEVKAMKAAAGKRAA
jgi:hypothetical protein